MKKVFSFLIVIILAQLSFLQELVKRIVEDKANIETLAGVTIHNPASCTGFNTSFDWSLSIKIHAGNPELKISHIGYSTKTIEVSTENYNLSIISHESEVIS